MINKKDLQKLQKEVELYDALREKVIKKSRDVLKLSKQVIYSVHRNDLAKAEKLKKDINKELKLLILLTKNHPSLYYSGSVKIAEQEYVEAVCFFDYVKTKKVTLYSKLNVSIESYLLGICDLTGELVRKAINEAIKGNFKKSVEIKNCVSDIYGELLMFDFRGGELRRKFDSIKYDLKKLEDLVLDLKLKGKIK